MQYADTPSIKSEIKVLATVPAFLRLQQFLASMAPGFSNGLTNIRPYILAERNLAKFRHQSCIPPALIGRKISHPKEDSGNAWVGWYPASSSKIVKCGADYAIRFAW